MVYQSMIEYIADRSSIIVTSILCLGIFTILLIFEPVIILIIIIAIVIFLILYFIDYVLKKGLSNN